MIYEVELNDKTYFVDLNHSSACITNVESQKNKTQNNFKPVESDLDAFDDVPDLFGEEEENTEEHGACSVKATIPGTILNVFVHESDVVKKGTPLLVFESMKMENEMKSPTDGKISKVFVKKGDRIENGKVLITMKEI